MRADENYFVTLYYTKMFIFKPEVCFTFLKKRFNRHWRQLTQTKYLKISEPPLPLNIPFA